MSPFPTFDLDLNWGQDQEALSPSSPEEGKGEGPFLWERMNASLRRRLEGLSNRFP